MLWNRSTLVAVIALSALAAIACGGSDPTPTSVPFTPAPPISFPYIFSGNFTVAGEPGPEGVPMFARLGDGRGPFNNSVRPGEYTNVSIAPQTTEDLGGEITFFLGHPDGPNVQAEETYIFNAPAEPEFVTLDLSFPRLP